MKWHDNPDKRQEAQNTLSRFDLDLDKSYVPCSKMAANLIKIPMKESILALYSYENKFLHLESRYFCLLLISYPV